MVGFGLGCTLAVVSILGVVLLGFAFPRFAFRSLAARFDNFHCDTRICKTDNHCDNLLTINCFRGVG